MSVECFAHCDACGADFPLGCVVPCPMAVYIAALTAAVCPVCCERTRLGVYEPGRQPPRTK